MWSRPVKEVAGNGFRAFTSGSEFKPNVFRSGPESMLAAAAAWDGVAAELTSAAVSYGSVVSTLIVEPWMGPAAAAMAAAATPYVGWLAATAALAKETATQARAAAEAFGTAFAMTVPPSSSRPTAAG